MSSIFANVIPDPVQVSLEYLEICKELPDIATHKTIETHVRHFIEFQWYVVHAAFVAQSHVLLLSSALGGHGTINFAQRCLHVKGFTTSSTYYAQKWPDGGARLHSKIMTHAPMIWNIPRIKTYHSAPDPPLAKLTGLRYSISRHSGCVITMMYRKNTTWGPTLIILVCSPSRFEQTGHDSDC